MAIENTEDLQIEIAANPETPLGVLEALSVDEDIYIRHVVGGNPSASHSILVRLANDEEAFVSGAVAGNPNTQVELLHSLLNGSVFFVAESASRRLMELARDPETNPTTLSALIKVEDLRDGKSREWCRMLVASNPSVTSAILEELATDTESIVRCWAAKNKNASLEVLSKLSVDPINFVREGVAANLRSSEKLLLALSEDADEEVRAQVARNPNVSLSILLRLSRDPDEEVRAQVAGNQNASKEILEFLYTEKSSEIEEKLLLNSTTPLPIIVQIVMSRDEYDRTRIAENTDTHLNILKILSQDQNGFVRREIAGNISSSGEILETLSKEEDQHIRSSVGRNASAPLHILSELASDSDPIVRAEVAKNQNAGDAILEKLSLDIEASVRAAVGGNNCTNLEILKILSQDTKSIVRSRVGGNPSSGLEILKKLALDFKSVVRYEVATNLNIDSNTLQTLSLDIDSAVRTAVATNLNTQFDVLKLLSEDADHDVRDSVDSDLISIASRRDQLKGKLDLQYFEEATTLFKRGLDQEGADILLELADGGHISSLRRLVYIFFEQEDFDDVKEILDRYPNQREPGFLYLRAKSMEKSNSLDLAAYIDAAEAGSLHAMLTLVEKYSSYDKRQAGYWLEKAEQIGFVDISHFQEMLQIRPLEKSYHFIVVIKKIDGVSTWDEIRIEQDDNEIAPEFSDLQEAIAFCISKEIGFDVTYLDDKKDWRSIYTRIKVESYSGSVTIASYEDEESTNLSGVLHDYWFGRLEDTQVAIDELIYEESDWELVFYVPVDQELDDEYDEDDEDDEDDEEDLEEEETPEKVGRPTWGSFRTFWTDCELTITPNLSGFIDIEGGTVGISGKWFETCSSCDSKISCSVCGRNSTNSFQLRAGNGDGIYSVFEISFEEKVVGALLILDEIGYAPATMETISNINEIKDEDPEALGEFYKEFYKNFYKSIGEYDQSLPMLFLGDIQVDKNPIYMKGEDPAGILIFGESGEGMDSIHSLVTVNNIAPGNYRSFVFAHRNEENENILVPRCVLILEENSANQIGLTKDFAEVINLKDEYERWNKSTVFARIGEPLAPYVISGNIDWCNLRFARELKAEDYETARDMRMEWLSWLLLLQSHFPSKETRELILDSAQELDLSRNLLLKARGQFNHELFDE